VEVGHDEHGLRGRSDDTMGESLFHTGMLQYWILTTGSGATCIEGRREGENVCVCVCVCVRACARACVCVCVEGQTVL